MENGLSQRPQWLRAPLLWEPGGAGSRRLHSPAPAAAATDASLFLPLPLYRVLFIPMCSLKLHFVFRVFFNFIKMV